MPAKYLALLLLLRNERRPPRQLRQLQQAKLRRLIHHAYHHVPFYRSIFEARGLVPENIQRVEDLQKLPVIDKTDLQAHAIPDLISDRHGSTADLVRISTSGSSGLPFDFYIDKRYNNLRKAQYLRPHLSNGRRLTDKVLRFTGFVHNDKKWFNRLGLLREWKIDCSVPHEAQITALRTYRPNLIQGYPSSLVSLGSVILDKGLDIPRPRWVFTDSELLTPQSRRIIEAAFQAPVIDIFGSFETENIAYECEHQQGYHVATDCVVLEILKDRKLVAGGEDGEMVCTVLDNLAMPLIRYNLRDIATNAPGPCRCGRTLPLLKMVAGRADDMVYLPGGLTQSPLSFLAQLDALSAVATEYQVIQESLERFQVLVVPGVQFDEAARTMVQSILTSRYPSVEVIVSVVDRIRREASGKFRAFISRLAERDRDRQNGAARATHL